MSRHWTCHILDPADLKPKSKPNYENTLTKRVFCYSFTLRERERVLKRRSLAWLEPVDRCPQLTIGRRRSNKAKDLLFSDDPAHLERTIRRGQHSTSLDATTSSSIDTHNQPSTDTRPSSSIDPNRSTTIDITPCTSIDTVSSKMVNFIILTQDENGNLYDQDGHLRNATVVRHEKLEEGDFKIGSSMSLGGSQWCRPMSMNSYRSTDHDEDRWTDNSSHRSTSSAKSTECNAVRILTHEEFASKHPHPPSPFYDKIDRSVEPTIDRQSKSDVDRHNTPPIDRQAPMTYRVRLPSIDNDYINALKPPPKPLANPPEPKPNPLNSSPEPVHEDQETEGRRLRKRKEKLPKNLKREANEKEMDGFTKIVLRIPIKKAFDEAYFTNRLWMFFRETKFAIPCVVKGVEFPHSMCDTGASDERFETHKFTNTFPTSLDEVHSTSVDTHPRPAKQPLTSIDTHTGTSINICAAAKIQEQDNIPSPTRDPDGNARAIDGRILQVSREDIADILQVANGPDNLFSQQRGTPDVIHTDPNKHVGVAATKINPDQSCQPKGHASIDGTTKTSIDRVTPTSIDKDDPTSIDRRYKFGHRTFDMYGARKFTWERRDEYGVYRDECGHARGIAGEMIPVTKDDIRKLLERASLFEEDHICLPEHATSFTLTRLAPELYTKDEINEMVTGICGAQEKLGDELKSLVEDTHQPLDRGYNELFRCMVEMRTKIESLRQQLEKEAKTSASINAPHAPSINVSLPTAQIPAKPQCSAEHKDEWEVSYIKTRINDVYYPLNNNVDWLNTKIELLQQDLDTIRKKDQQPATSIDVCTITSLDAKILAMDNRLQTYEDMHDRFANSFSIDRLRGPWIDGKNLVELLPYTAAEVDKITSKIYTTIDTMEERLDKRCDDIYFPFDNRISGLDSHAEWLQKEVKALQRQLAAQHQISASIDRKRAKSLDGKSPRSTDEHLIASIDIESTPDGEQLIHKTIKSMHEELTELSTYTYNNISWHQVSINNVQDRLQNISNVLEKMDDKWTRNDDATRRLGGGNLQGLLSLRILGYKSKRSEQSLVATTIKF
ncbi:hypothetical protein IGI04_015732 [Brassica rapa subsp. trilocularis]|uniref:Uncharacterized protein n=1 Tax=Brassica rapa subsp. trilocularis TaxID=1813537 RepID=A0ABQ7MTG8_BRACM|nr:hypothetical protein IGI04_015732 [Brassica rapa subsp. trilocularis]